MQSGATPVGSRRRRAALKISQNIPFEQLPYQCFQEARKILQVDRQTKLRQIEVQRARIERLAAQPVSAPGATTMKETRLASMRRHLEQLKILADINDPLVKKRYEDGDGDLNKPIYRHLAERKFRALRRAILVQRIEQMHLVPDLLQTMNITADMHLRFTRNQIAPGAFVPSVVSEHPPRLNVHVYDRGERLVTVAVLDPDVPNVNTDAFDTRVHYLASNISISPTATFINLQKILDDNQLAYPWLSPHAQKGSPYHRLAIFILEQGKDHTIDVSAVKSARPERLGFNLQGFVHKHKLKPIGAYLFRTIWDEGTDAVMRRAGIEGVEEELKRKRVEPLPYKWKPSMGKKYR